eukprot:4329204-Prymnesium_polylepis.1
MFIIAHLATEGKIATHLHEKMEEARMTGALTPKSGSALLKFLKEWIIIRDPQEQVKAKRALQSIQVLQTHTIVELETIFWWATSIVARLPSSERTAECDVQTRMVEGLQGELVSRKIIIQSQLEIAAMIAGGTSKIDPANFLLMIAKQLA